MNMKNYLKYLFPALIILNVVLGFSLMSFPVRFFVLPLPLKILFIAIIYFIPIWIYVPLLLPSSLVALFIKKGQSYKTTLFWFTKRLLLVVNVLILFTHMLHIFQKVVLGKEFFKRELYSEIVGTSQSCDDLKEGEFKYDQTLIIRKEHTQTEIFLEYSDTVDYNIFWLSDNEYCLTLKNAKDHFTNDTAFFRITNNQDTFYEGYSKFGEYALKFKVEKK